MFQPVADRIVARLVKLKSNSRIIIPDEQRKEMPIRCRVVAVGPGRILEGGQLEPMPVKSGDIIVFHRFSGTIVQDAHGEALVILRASDVLCIDPDAEAMLEQYGEENAIGTEQPAPVEEPKKGRRLFGGRD